MQSKQTTITQTTLNIGLTLTVGKLEQWITSCRKQETIKIQEASKTQTTQTSIHHDNTLRFATELDRYVMFNITELRNTSVESPVYLVYSQCEAILPSCGNQKLSQPA